MGRERGVSLELEEFILRKGRGIEMWGGSCFVKFFLIFGVGFLVFWRFFVIRL